jgi:hypothetical protein
VVVKNVKIQSFFFLFIYIYFFFILSPNLSQKSHHTAQELNSTDEVTLGHHGGVTGTHLDQLLPKNGQHITRISPTNPNYNPQATQTPSVHIQLTFTYTPIYTYTLYISLLHITSYLQPKLVYFPCMTAAAYNTTLTCKHIRT